MPPVCSRPGRLASNCGGNLPVQRPTVSLSNRSSPRPLTSVIQWSACGCFGEFRRDLDLGKLSTVRRVDRERTGLLVDQRDQLDLFFRIVQIADDGHVGVVAERAEHDQGPFPNLKPVAFLHFFGRGAGREDQHELRLAFPSNIELEAGTVGEGKLLAHFGAMRVGDQAARLLAPQLRVGRLPLGQTVGPAVNGWRSVAPRGDAADRVAGQVQPAELRRLDLELLRRHAHERPVEQVAVVEFEHEVAGGDGRGGRRRAADRAERGDGKIERLRGARHLPAEDVRLVAIDQPAAEEIAVAEVEDWAVGSVGCGGLRMFIKAARVDIEDWRPVPVDRPGGRGRRHQRGQHEPDRHFAETHHFSARRSAGSGS